MTLDEFKASDIQSDPHCLLLGHPVEHSLSPRMHGTAARYYDLSLNYHAVDVSPSDLNTLPPLFNASTFVGANVTIPYKQQIMEFVDRTSPAARQIGAVNTLYLEDNILWGCNTDAYGFSVPLEPYRDFLVGETAVVFGTGGAARAVVHALGEMGMEEIILISRHPGRKQQSAWPERVKFAGYSNWSAYGNQAQLIVNTTPLGMDPNVNQSPVRESEKQVLAEKICYDLVYRPRNTQFLQLASQVDATVIGGLDMLIHQGSRSFEYWTGKSFPIDHIKKSLNDVL